MSAIASARSAVFSTLFDLEGKSPVAKQLDSLYYLANHRQPRCALARAFSALFRERVLVRGV